MSLDLIRIASQVGDMIARLKAGSAERQAHLKRALDVVHDKNINLDHLKNKIIASRTTWLVAGLTDGLAHHYPAPPLPPEFTVMASDGSHIDVDRHKSTRCYLINIGVAVLHYGASPGARLESFPRLYSDDADLVITSGGGKVREQPIEGALLGVKRSVEECRKLVELASELPPDSTALALIDGTLILWSLEGFPEFVVEALLNNGFLPCLDELRKLSKGRKLALASYISFPRSTDVVNALRLALCPHEPADCDRYCSGGDPVSSTGPAPYPSTERACDVVSGVQDRALFSNLLSPGERSALFISGSSIVEKRYGAHGIYFFYLRVDDEIARVEVPQWVAMDESLLGLVHALVLDQCQRGQGYPVALSEAHEQAVVTAADKEEFWQFVDSSLVEEHMPGFGSMKSLSKRTRWI